MPKQSRRPQRTSAKKAAPQTSKKASAHTPKKNPVHINTLQYVKLSKRQQELANIIAKNQITICTGPAGTAKAQPLHSKILTPSGWTTMGKLKVGHIISDTDGNNQKVIGIYPQGIKEIWEVKLLDGSIVECTEDHLWEIVIGGDKKVVNTLELSKLLENDSVYLPNVSRINFIDQPLQCKLSPKTLGAVACKSIVKKRDIIIDIDVPDWVLENLRDIVYRPFAADSDANRFYGATKTLGLVYDLKRINYSVQDRLDILQGAAEACGFRYIKDLKLTCVSKFGADWISDIARSLGYYIKRHSETTIEIFERYEPKREIYSVTKTDRSENCQCIKVSNSNSLYVTDNFVVTHNTYVSTFSALSLLDSGEYDRIILTKPIQESGEKLGFLPGDVDEKIAPYMESFVTTMEKMVGYEVTKDILDRGVVEARPLAYMRGSTFDKCIMILDEAQNCDLRQLILFVTRMGETSKVIICGDVEQNDVPKAISGLLDFIKITKGIAGIESFEFMRDDIVRSKILISITDSYSKWKSNNSKG